MELRVAHLYPEVMNLYGDRGNAIALRARCQRRGIACTILPVNIGDPLDPGEVDIVLVGGGQDREQRRIAPDLLRRGPALRDAVDAGLPVLAVCGGYQLFGHRYVDHDGSVIPGIGVFDAETRHPGPVADRCIGDIVVETPFGEVVGFENHGGRTYLAPGQEPLGTVRLGRGNNAEDRTEGARRKNAIGTYLHGSVLPKNPALADALILAALRRRYGPSVELPPLDDAPERRAHEAALRTALARARSPV
ncbi:type 1 glutamine amidotransferase [Tepidiforma bonchosmolovskayae]|uniref:Lipid II isoglutaminyl synthase (glutamine-hydrolyzing) subunit GatD n=1 Tax=Tepidiforma bonchosmolovskayae TaxID=2601677 RepID=A0ABX6C1G5_9CHLR|nr:glutamine amidotransferase [Tepidiforma bonchosmolovskayae]QFG03121.1 glutamine amidotransferase [Tepidiforma bonchosmolovskayae]